MKQTASGIWVPPSAALGTNKKAPPPKFGESFGQWAGTDTQYLTLPGGGIIAFDLSRLTLNDFRMMRDHYQINASLAALMFMLHQIEWHVKCEDKKIQEECEEQLRTVWTRLVRVKGQSFWAGYSPNALQWENDTNGRRVVLTKIKDLLPERCQVNWKLVEGWAPPDHAKPKFKVYDGIKETGASFPIPVDNTYWYPLMMENGDYYGRKLLRPAFASWFFSILVHLFANRYFERFGEPTPVGRAPYDDTIIINTDTGTQTMTGQQLMLSQISQLRNRSAVVLPNDSTGDGANAKYDYTLEYLESQMRGADFERYLTRLDEEMTLSLFMPLLLLRTADVGSYNLGTGHMQLWLWMLNALTGDWKDYIDRYILQPIKKYNFSENAPKVEWVPRQLGKNTEETVRTVLQTLLSKDKIKVDVRELGEQAGLTLEEVKELTQPAPDPTDPTQPQPDPTKTNPNDREVIKVRVKFSEPKATTREIISRVSGQVAKAYREGTFGSGFKPSLGFRRRFEESLKVEGVSDPSSVADNFYNKLEKSLADLISLGVEEFPTSEEFVSLFSRLVDLEVEELANAA